MCTLEKVKIYFEILAYFSAAIFFVFKAFSGVFYVSLGLDLDIEKREKLNDDMDILVCDLKLIGGENALLDIHKIQARVTYNSFEKIFDFQGVNRLDIKNNNNELVIQQPWKTHFASKYRISVKDETYFCEEITIPKDSISKVEIIVIGSRKKLFGSKPTISQWRISKISLPIR